MTRFDLLKQTDVGLASRIIFELSKSINSEDELNRHLRGEITEKELQRINDAALKEGCQPLSSSFKQ